MLPNTFQDSVITLAGKLHFAKPGGGLDIQFSHFKMCNIAGTIENTRTDQTGVKYEAIITSASRFEDGDVIGYRLTCTIPRGAVEDNFNIEEIGLYDNLADPCGDSCEVLCWVGKPDLPIFYTSATEVSIEVILPISATDVTVDIETNPINIVTHNDDLNSHPYILSKMADAGLIESTQNGKNYLEITPAQISNAENGKYYYMRADAKFDKAIADGTEKANVIGVYIEVASRFFIRFNGMFLNTGAYERGKKYYLSGSVAGEISNTPTTNEVEIGVALDNNTLIISFNEAGNSVYKTLTDSNLVAIEDNLQNLTDSISNLSSAQAEITSTASQDITLTQTLMPFEIVTDSTDTDILTLDDSNDEITFKENLNYNFMSTVTLKSTTASAVTVTFKLIDISDDSVVATQTALLDIGNGNTEILPLNTLVNLITVPKTIRIECVADVLGIELVSFSSILAGGFVTSLDLTGKVETIDTVEEILSLSITKIKSVNVKGYYTANDGAGGSLNYDSTILKSTANGITIIDPDQTLANQGSGTGTGCWVRQYSGALNAKWSGARGDGVTDDVIPLQKMHSIVKITHIHYPAGTFYITNSIKLTSNTMITGEYGSSKMKMCADADWTGIDDDHRDGSCFINENFAATELTDKDISISNIFVDYTLRDWSTGVIKHMVGFYFRMASNIKVANCQQVKGGDMTAYRYCFNTEVSSNIGTDVGNSTFDHWDNSGYAIVRDNISLAITSAPQQAIQFTGDTTAWDSEPVSEGHGSKIVITGNIVKNLVDGNNSGIILNCLHNDTTIKDAVINGNNIEGGSYGIVLERGTKNTTITGNVISKCTQFGILVTSGTNPSSNFVINGNTIEGGVGSDYAMDIVTATDGLISNNVIRKGDSAYNYGIRLQASTTNIKVSENHIEVGGNGEILNTGTNNIFDGYISLKNSGALLLNGVTPNTAWQTLDLSAIVGANRTLCFLRYENNTGAVSGIVAKTFGHTMNNAADDTQLAGPNKSKAQNGSVGYLMVETDADGKLEWYTFGGAGGSLKLLLRNFNKVVDYLG